MTLSSSDIYKKALFNLTSRPLLLYRLCIFILFIISFYYYHFLALLSRTATWFHFPTTSRSHWFWSGERRRAVNTDDSSSTVNTRHGSRAFLSDTAECVKRLLELIVQMETQSRIIILWYYYYYYHHHYGGMRFLPSRTTAPHFPAESELGADEAVTAGTWNIKERRGLFMAAFHQGSCFHDSSSVILSCNRGTSSAAARGMKLIHSKRQEM